MTNFAIWISFFSYWERLRTSIKRRACAYLSRKRLEEKLRFSCICNLPKKWKYLSLLILYPCFKISKDFWYKKIFRGHWICCDLVRCSWISSQKFKFIQRVKLKGDRIINCLKTCQKIFEYKKHIFVKNFIKYLKPQMQHAQLYQHWFMINSLHWSPSHLQAYLTVFQSFSPKFAPKINHSPKKPNPS